MYYAHFGLKEPPFKITPNTEFFYSGGNRGAVLDALLYAITTGEGIIKVVGEVGSGKTMLCRMLQTRLPENVESIYLANPSVAPEDVLHAIAFELQLKLPKNADRLRVMQGLQDYLVARHTAGKQVVIFVEEAQGMPLETLEEIRLLSNLETKRDKLLQIVLFGQPELDDNLNQNQIRQLRERITHSFYLSPFAKSDTGNYIDFRLRKAGYVGPPLLTKYALRILSHATQGSVRRANILADKALLASFSENVYQVTHKHVIAAIRDSEFGVASNKKPWWVWLLWVFGLVAFLALCWFIAPKFNQMMIAYDAQSSHVSASIKPQIVEAEKPPQPESAQNTHKVEPVKIEHQAMFNDVLLQRFSKTTEWLEKSAPDRATIQVVGTYNEEELRTYLKIISNSMPLDSLFVYKTKVNGSPFYSVTYGDYDNLLQAQAAIRDIPAYVKSNSPQVRTVAGIAKEINAYQ